MTENELEVIRAAWELVETWEGSHYGPMPQRQIEQNKKALIKTVANLAADTEGIKP